jgi:hypothetical protein
MQFEEIVKELHEYLEIVADAGLALDAVREFV